MAGPWEEYQPAADVPPPWAEFGGDAKAAPAEAKKPTGAQRLGALLNDIPRQVGLTARHALEGGAQAAEIVTEPARFLTDALLPARERTVSDLVTDTPAPPKSTPLRFQATKLADAIGLPKPANDLERVVGEGTKLGFGAMGMSGAAGAADKVLQAGSRAVIGQAPSVAAQLAANPASQVSGAAGAGMAGQASKEAGGTPGAQAVASFVGGLAGGMAPEMLKRGGSAVMAAVQPRQTEQQLELQISNALAQRGVNWNELTPGVRDQMRRDAQRALSMGGQLDEVALANLATLRDAGFTPTRAAVTQNPLDVTREKNLEKLAANTASGAGSELPLIANRNNAQAVRNLNDLGAQSGRGATDVGNTLQGSIVGQRDALRGTERAAWNTVEGNQAFMQQPFSPAPLNDIIGELDRRGRLRYLPKATTDLMAEYQNGNRPFTAQAYADLMHDLSGLKTSAESGTRTAAGMASQMLERANLAPIKPGAHLDSGGLPVTGATAAAMRAVDEPGEQIIGQVNTARAATRDRAQYERTNRVVRAALHEDADPTKLAQRFVIGGTPAEAAMVHEQLSPAGREAVREALLTEIKRKATGGAQDATANVGASTLRGAINSIGEDKLRLFLTPEELQRLRSTSRGVDLLLNQPRGSAVGNSNSGQVIQAGLLDFLDRAGARIPVVGGALQVPQMVRVASMNRAAQNVSPGLLAYDPVREASSRMGAAVIPAGLLGTGLLVPPQ